MRFPIFYGFFAPRLDHDQAFRGAEAAFDLAGLLSGQLSVMIGEHILSPVNLLGSSLVESLLASERKSVHAAAKDARARIDRLARTTEITAHVEQIEGDLPALTRLIASRARLHGLIFAELGVPRELLYNELIEPFMFGSGRPVFIVPHGYAKPISLKRILIAWDGSLHAARAAWDAMPLLRLAEAIEIVTVTGEKDLGVAPAADALAPMLAFLDASITATAIKFDGGSAASLIARHAELNAMNLIIQGAYGRSRWREFILGGVTREMLRDSTLPVLMSH
jgi:nucleotide-binding universal stress UspA family protein